METCCTIVRRNVTSEAFNSCLINVSDSENCSKCWENQCRIELHLIHSRPSLHLRATEADPTHFETIRYCIKNQDGSWFRRSTERVRAEFHVLTNICDTSDLNCAPGFTCFMLPCCSSGREGGGRCVEARSSTRLHLTPTSEKCFHLLAVVET